MFLTFLLLSAIASPLQAQKPEKLDYCVHHERNTPCVYDCMRSSKCGDTGTSFRLLNDGERKYVLQLHNTLGRGEFLMGNYKIRLPDPRIFPLLSYDKECEFIAGCAAKQCRNRPDKLRITLDGTRLGQNRFALSFEYRNGSYDKIITNILVRALHTWLRAGKVYSEEYKPTDIIPQLHESYFVKYYPHKTAEFTQVLWQNTTHMGCAVMHSKRHVRLDTFELICNYKPAGNILGHRVYDLKNDIPSNCSFMVYEGRYFCEGRPFEEDTYIPPIDLNKCDKGQYTFLLIFVVYLDLLMI